MKKLTSLNSHTLFCLVAALFLFQLTKAQNIPQYAGTDFWDHVRFGGGIGLSFGSDYFSATLAPSAIYEINPQFAVGTGLNFTYASEKDFYNSTVVGGSLLALFSPLRELQLSAEFEELYVTRNYESRIPIENESYWYPALFLGAGFNTGPVTIGARYDVLFDDTRSIYGNALIPFVRVYF